MVIRLPIDTKSLYFNIKNDNESGHTATVATPLKQGASVHHELLEIMNFPDGISNDSKEKLIDQLLKNSRADAKIVKICVFDKISVNGVTIDAPASFCIYVREETNISNVHYGRQKIHYPPSLRYDDSEININNKLVCKALSEYLKQYAFIVEAFEYDDVSRILNFSVIIVGQKEIPYSKVFINRKGVGNKFSSVFNDEVDLYDSEIIALREKLGFGNVSPDNYNEIMTSNRLIAQNQAETFLIKSGASDIRRLVDEYPYSLYDFEYVVDGEKRFLLVCYTATNKRYFAISLNKVKFCNDFPSETRVLLITDICGNKKQFLYTNEDLNSFSKTINSITFDDLEG
ncbi:MAG: hypothetical protein RR347_04710 [Anaerovoracaceae bacterium]